MTETRTNLPSSFLCGEIETQRAQETKGGADTHKEYFRISRPAGAHQPGVEVQAPLRCRPAGTWPVTVDADTCTLWAAVHSGICRTCLLQWMAHVSFLWAVPWTQPPYTRLEPKRSPVKPSNHKKSTLARGQVRMSTEYADHSGGASRWERDALGLRQVKKMARNGQSGFLRTGDECY